MDHRRIFVTVAAVTAVLFGVSVPAWAYFTASASSNVSAGAATLASVTNVTPTATDGYDVTVAWTNPSPANPSGTIYTASTGSHSCTSTGTSCTVTGLSPGTSSYTFSVAPSLGTLWTATAVTGSTSTPALSLSLVPAAFSNLPASESGTLTGFPTGATLTWHLDSQSGTSLTGSPTLPAGGAISVVIPAGTTSGTHHVYVVSGAFVSFADVTYTPPTGPDAPTSVTLVGGGVGNAYINSSNTTGVTVNVVVPATSKATDTVHLTLGDGVHTVTTATKPGIANGGTVSFSTGSLTTINDGPVTLTAWVTNATGTSANTVATYTKDTVAPTAVSAANSDGDGKMENGDTLSMTFSEALDPASVPSTSATVTQKRQGNTTNLDVNDLLFAGNPNISGTYQTKNTTTTAVGTRSLSANQLTVTITLSALNDGGATTGSGSLTVAPASTFTDLAGNVVSTSTVTFAKLW